MCKKKERLKWKKNNSLETQFQKPYSLTFLTHGLNVDGNQFVVHYIVHVVDFFATSTNLQTNQRSKSTGYTGQTSNISDPFIAFFLDFQGRGTSNLDLCYVRL